MPIAVTPFLMFEGNAEAAMNLYASVFKDAHIVSIDRYGAGEPGGTDGSVKRAEMIVAGQRLQCIDSAVKHGFSFTPAFSLFVDCDSEAELRAIHDVLSNGGAVLMPLDNYGFSDLFTWFNDRFGVSWQLSWSNVAL